MSVPTTVRTISNKLVKVGVACTIILISYVNVVLNFLRGLPSVSAMVRRRSSKRAKKSAARAELDCAKLPAIFDLDLEFDCPPKVKLWMKADIYLGDGVGGVRNLYRHLTIWKALVEFQRRSGFTFKRRVKRVSWRDEEPGGKVVGGGGEYGGSMGVTDPAVLAMGPVSTAARPTALRYGIDRLLDMRFLPLCKRFPECLNAYDCIVRKRAETPVDEDRGGRGDMPEVHKRRSADPRERVRKESSPGPGGAGVSGVGAAGVVLSPQRRSFTSGCYIPVGSMPANNNTVNAQKTDTGGFTAGREQRRIGSGRILQRDMTTVPWERGANVNNTNNSTSNDDNSNEYTQSYRQSNSVLRDRNDDRYERRSYGRDSYSSDNKRDKEDRYVDRRDRDRDENRRSRYNDRRRFDKDDEPEWFSGGPTSQLDTIELRGFDDPLPSTKPNKFVNGKDSARDKSSGSISTSDSSVMKSLDASSVSGSNSNSGVVPGSGGSPEPAPPPARSTPTPRTAREENATGDSAILKISNQEQNGESEHVASDIQASDFNLEDFLKYDNIPGLLSNGSIDDTSQGSSRFSQWFKRDSPTQSSQLNRYHDNVHERAINHLIDDVDLSVSISNSEVHHLFAPISPAASSGPAVGLSSGNALQQSTTSTAPGQNQQGHSGNLFDMLQRNQQAPNKAKDAPAKMHNLEELEARMRGRAGSGRIPQSQLTGIPPQVQSTLPTAQHPHSNMQQPQRDDEVLAFKRLLAQVSEGQAASTVNGPMSVNKQQPMSLLQMLNKSQQQDQVMEQQRQQQQQAHIPPDLLYKLFHLQQKQQQQDMNNKVMSGPPNRHFQQVSPIPSDLQSAINNAQPSRELLSRPEAQAIIRGLKHGEITIQNLVQQISNPGLQTRHRETLITILKMYQQNRPPSPPCPPAMRMGPQAPGAQANVSQGNIPSHQLLVAPHQQQLRVSPLPPNVFPPRIPSPRELQVHTQSIMHNALIKRKLEEQEQNFRRKQEAAAAAAASGGSSGGISQHGRNTPSTVVSPNKQPPLAFTPTSVLRKMTAEKDGDLNNSGMVKPSQGSWSLQQPQPKMPQGRPIVKGNQGGISGPLNAYQQPPNQDFPSQAYMNHHQQQFLTSMQQQQLQIAARNKMAASNVGPVNMSSSGSQQTQFSAMMMHMQQQQQRQVPHSLQGQINNNRNSANTGLHQLLQMHSHHRNLNDVGSRGMSMGRGGDVNSSGALSPTSNQLARWFSPELLAQATAGKLPPVNMAANALSLEELERIQHSSAIVHN